MPTFLDNQSAYYSLLTKSIAPIFESVSAVIYFAYHFIRVASDADEFYHERLSEDRLAEVCRNEK